MKLLNLFGLNEDKENFSFEEYLKKNKNQHKGEKFRVEHIDFTENYVSVFLDKHPPIVIPSFEGFPISLFTLVEAGDLLIKEGAGKYTNIPILYNETANCYFYSEDNEEWLQLRLKELEMSFDYHRIYQQIKIAYESSSVKAFISKIYEGTVGEFIKTIKNPIYTAKLLWTMGLETKLALDIKKRMKPVEFECRILNEKSFLKTRIDSNGNKLYRRRYFYRVEHKDLRKHFYCFHNEEKYKDETIKFPPKELNSLIKINGKIEPSFGYILINKAFWGNKRIIKKGGLF